jgi:hypothetical protein
MVLKEEERTPECYSPLVAIGHTKDLVDLGTIESFLSYLAENGIAVSTLEDAYRKCKLST